MTKYKLGKMICFHKDIGCKHNIDKKDYSSWNDIQLRICVDYQPIVILPLYTINNNIICGSLDPIELHIHYRILPGIFNDEKVIGFIICPFKRAKKEYKEITTYDVLNTSPKIIIQIIKQLKKEIEIYNLKTKREEKNERILQRI